MQDVNIYINAYHTGHLKHGKGTYTIVLEYITRKNIPVTKEYIKGLSNTTLNRTALSSCIIALKDLIKECNVTLYINSVYVTRAINEGFWHEWIATGLNAKGKLASNIDLWQQLYDLASNHNVNFIYQEINPYTTYMLMMAKKIKIEYKEDNDNV